MLWVVIKSKWANWTLAFAGFLYVVSGIVLLCWLTLDTWGAAGLLDRGLQVMLLVVVTVGLWLAVNSLRNRGVRMPRLRVGLRQHAAIP
ncbi:MAG: hypothetical protein WA208_14435 [Thermoanaerobaculia bacterium]